MHRKKGLIIILVFCFGFAWWFAYRNDPNPLTLYPIYKPLDSIQAIAPITDSLIAPIVYTNVISLSELPVDRKKQKFIAMLLPAILVAKQEIEKSRSTVATIRKKLTGHTALSHQEEIFLNLMMKRYNASHIDSLDTKLTTPPNSIVLAQAALECGWGTSRFFMEGCNVFGIWSFRKSDKRIKSSSNRKGGKEIYLKKYENLSASIEDYFRVLGKLNVYKDFRQKRKTSNDPYELVPHLHPYSESGKSYTIKLAKLIHQNNLTQYDHYQIDSSYFVEESWW